MPPDPAPVQAQPDNVTVTAGGHFYKIPAANVGAFSEKIGGGVKILSPEETAAHEAEKQATAEHAAAQAKYGGLGGQIATGAVNAADALTLGFGKGIAGEIGGQATKEWIHGHDVANPLWAIGGQGLGMGVGLLYGGTEARAAAEGVEGAGLLARGLTGAREIAGAPTRLLTRLGGAAERGVQSMVGTEAKSLAGRLAQRGLAEGASGAAQGAVLGLGQTFSDASIENHPLTAEHLIAGMAKGALFGGALGAGMGATSELGGKVLDHMHMPEGSLTEARDAFALRSTGAKASEMKALRRAGIDPNEMGSWIAEEMPKYSDKPLWRMTREDIQEVAKKSSDEIGSKIGDAISELDAMATKKGIKPNVADIASTVQEQVIKPLREMPGLDGHANQIQKYVDSFAEKSGVMARDEAGKLVPTGSTGEVGFGELKKFRYGLDSIIRESGAKQEKIIGDAFSKTRDVLESEMNKQGEHIAGKEWLDNYSGLKKQYKFAENLEQIGKKVEERAQTAAQGATFSDKLFAAAGLAAHGPLGLLEGVGHHLIHDVVHEHGNQVAAYVLDRASKIQAIKSMAQKQDVAMDAGLSRFFGEAKNRGRTAAIQATVASKKESFRQVSDNIRQLAQNPQMMAAHVSQTLPPADVAGKLGPVMAQKQAAQISWLDSQIPPGFKPSPLTPTIKNPPPHSDVDSFMRKVEVLKDPVGTVTKNMAKGTLNKDHVDALKNLYPEIYATVQQKTMTHLADLAGKGDLPPFSKRLQLGILLGIPSDASLEPSFISSQQMLYTGKGKAASQSAGNPPSAPQNQRGSRHSLASGEDALDEA